MRPSCVGLHFGNAPHPWAFKAKANFFISLIIG